MIKTLSGKIYIHPDILSQMKLEHVAIYTERLEELKAFYSHYFQGTPGQIYVNEKKKFKSYFVSFETGARIEIMRREGIYEKKNGQDYIGIVHFAFEVEDEKRVDGITDQIAGDGYEIADGPRITGDGYYESTILDPDGNRVEIFCRKS